MEPQRPPMRQRMIECLLYVGLKVFGYDWTQVQRDRFRAGKQAALKEQFGLQDIDVLRIAQERRQEGFQAGVKAGMHLYAHYCDSGHQPRREREIGPGVWVCDLCHEHATHTEPMQAMEKPDRTIRQRALAREETQRLPALSRDLEDVLRRVERARKEREEYGQEEKERF